LNRSQLHREEFAELLADRAFDLITIIEQERAEHGPFCDELMDLIAELTEDINGTAYGEIWNG